MSRRPSLPGAAELFRVTGGPAPAPASAAPAPAELAGEAAARPVPFPGPLKTPPDRAAFHADVQPARPAATSMRSVPEDAEAADDDEGLADPAGSRRSGTVRQTGSRRRMRPVGERRPSGRQRHEEKITVYCSAEELVDLEQARLALRAEHGLVVDRGRIVREAVAVVLADLEAKGESSILVRRLRES
ncbi:MAG TPA: hypothetical protein VLJ59_07940 [Mycobacteriales bacterium]|nr:hypothetical protein [Mycobacteriales bacterium]